MMGGRYGFEKKFREQILMCSRCGFCQAVCPLYGLTLRPALNARGKILVLKEVMEGKIELNEELGETLFQCTTCAGCTENCPSGVKVPEIIVEARRDMARKGLCHPSFKGMGEILGRCDNIYGEEEAPDFGKARNRKAEYVYFVGCVGSYREEEATRDVLKLLDHLGVDYTLIDEVCCSGVLEDVGYQINEDLARKNTERVLSTGAKTLITGCPYCLRTFKGKPQYEGLRERGISIIHISQFLKDVDLGVRTKKRVTYHDPCDLGRHSGIYEEPRRTIKGIAPNFVEMASHHEKALCCGAGGGVRAAYARNSIDMARRRLKEAEECNAEVVLTECNSCVHNLLNAKLRKQNIAIYTTSQFVNRLLEGKEH
ncbi:MAG: (Fe-S)-binding protein [Deltaproteobacteria bacterium]|nr:(Fe-S)-binding protein [Deltaproteobacteria bacterium]MBW2137685.1 (Fe-S)-binding protein [Deltaproteobacteria bacterium]